MDILPANSILLLMFYEVLLHPNQQIIPQNTYLQQVDKKASSRYRSESEKNYMR